MVIIDGFVIDVAKAEDVTLASTITAFPIESGASITDHVINTPPVIAIDGIVSDSPLAKIDTLRTIGSLPSNDAQDHLVRIRTAKEPITLVTSLGTFEQMVMQSLSMPKDENTGAALVFRATFKQIELVTNERTTIRVSVPRAKKKQERGTVPAKQFDYSNLFEENDETPFQELADLLPFGSS